MNILLVRPKPHRQTINLQSFMICEPLELEYLSAFMEQQGHTVWILDMILEKKPLSYFLKEYKPDIVGFTGYLPHINVIKEYAARVKAFDSAIINVVGGVHADVRPQDFADDSIDYVVSGSGMKGFAAIARGQSPESAGSDNSLDYPFPDRKKTERYRKNYNYVFHSRCATIKTSFGCPYNCDFCFCARVTKGGYSCRELSGVIDELRQIKEKNVFIVDDDFLFDKDRVEAFCRLVKESGIDKRYILFGRTDFIANNPDTIALLKSIGLHAIFMGIESFRQEELDGFNKRTAVEQNLKAVRLLESEGIICYCGLMVGKDWDRNDFDSLITYLKTFRYPFVNIQPVTPIPGTPFYERVKSELKIGLERCELWDMAHVIMKPEKMTEKEFYKNIVRAYRKTSLMPRVHLMILREFGIKAYLRACRGALCIAAQYRELIRKGCVFTEEENSIHTADHL